MKYCDTITVGRVVPSAPRRAEDSPPYQSWLRCDCGGFLDGLGKGQFDTGEIERRKDIRMRCIFEIRNQSKSQQRMEQE